MTGLREAVARLADGWESVGQAGYPELRELLAVHPETDDGAALHAAPSSPAHGPDPARITEVLERFAALVIHIGPHRAIDEYGLKAILATAVDLRAGAGQ